MFIVYGKHCGRCGNLVDFRFESIGEYGRRSDTGMPGIYENNSDAGPEVDGFGVAICPRCFGPTLFEFRVRRRYIASIKTNLSETKGHMGGDSLIKVAKLYPPQREPDTDPSWPPELVRLFADAQRMMDQRMTPSMILTACRTVLDIATTKLDPGNSREGLFKRIEALLRNGVITKPIADWAHAIRLDGNTAVHEGIGEEADAAEYVEFLKLFLNVAFALPKRTADRKNPTH